MSGAEALAAAVLDLYPSGVKVYDGQVDTVAGVVPTPPWVFVTISLPDLGERSLGRTAHRSRVMVRSLVFGLNATAVRQIADLLSVLDGARPAAAGWRTTRLEQINAREPVEDRDVTVASTGKHPMVGVLEHEFIASVTS